MRQFYLTACKAFVLLALCCAWSDKAKAANIDTDDYITINEVTLVPGSSDTYKVVVSLVGSRIYTACQMDIEFPPGLEPVLTRNMYVRVCNGDDDLGPDHTVASSYGKVGEHTMRLSCYSGVNLEYAATSGQLLYFNVKASAYLKPGDVTLKVTNCDFITKEDAQKYHCKEQTLTLTAKSESSLSFTVSADSHYATGVFPFPVATLPDGMKAYRATGIDDSGAYVVLNEVDNLAAYTPYILYSKGGYTGTLSGTVDATGYAETVSDGCLYGAIAAQKQTDGYVLQDQGDGAKFYAMDGQEFNIPEGKCWLQVESEKASSAFFGLIFDDTPAGISSAVATTPAAKAIYTLDGMRVSEMQPGRIYVVGGQKILKLKQ